MTNQPKWKLVANLGDVNPVDHGGLFVFVDVLGNYPPEMEKLEPPCDDDDNGTWEVRRCVMEDCTYQNGILSDNRFHPDHAAWFATPESERADRPQDTTYLANVASCMDVSVDDLIAGFTSQNPIDRAHAWRCVGDYHGWDNFDSYPLELTRSEANARVRRHDKSAKVIVRPVDVLDEDTLIDALPHGSGIDARWEVTELKNGNLVAECGFHGMDENGYYDGWQSFKVIVRPVDVIPHCCPQCKGRGFRTLQEIADIRKVDVSTIDRDSLHVDFIDDDRFTCNSCRGDYRPDVLDFDVQLTGYRVRRSWSYDLKSYLADTIHYCLSDNGILKGHPVAKV